MSARKRVRAYLAAPSIHETVPANELLGRRWENGGGGRSYDVRVQDLQELLRSERAARATVRTQAGQIQILQRKHNAALAAISRRARDASEQAAELSRAYTHAGRDDFKQMYETARAEAVRLQREVDRQAGLLQGAHKDAERLRAELDRERENATRLAKKLDAARPRTYADILREARPENGKWSTDYFLALMQAVKDTFDPEPAPVPDPVEEATR